MRWTPPAAIAAKPLEIPDALGTGVTLYTVRADARAYAPFRDDVGAMRSAFFATRWFTLMASLPEAARKLFDGDELTDEESIAGGEALAKIDFDAFAELSQEAKRAAQNGFKGPEEAAKVASLILGWSGVESEDGSPIEHTTERAAGMLTDGVKGDAEAAFLVDGQPYRIPAGPWAGYTMGQALASFLPEEIARLSAEEAVDRDAKKKRSTRGRSGTRGSSTARTKSARRPTKRGKSASK